MVTISDERFEELVDMGLDLIPEELLSRLTNVVIRIEDRNPDSPDILGLYEGVALPDRTNEFSGFLPDTITIYKESLKEYCVSERQLVEQVGITVVHEIAHYFGIDDARLHELGWG
ncbi:Possibl zinc metallo-peptidase [Corynebacterium ciconiae DSM 44920]|uniref:metallopeptidase family protein n=1 Tax=Corynebacterium ciconiae TaxID=227319 RepID=UPI00037B868B|nr:metallopeptidase family protein [Corynebacterium ciconiae]WKD60226.1 Possibl zinc metallo-peptidase [Corynebacterium ciconiae DSM 44920]